MTTHNSSPDISNLKKKEADDHIFFFIRILLSLNTFFRLGLILFTSGTVTFALTQEKIKVQTRIKDPLEGNSIHLGMLEISLKYNFEGKNMP